MMLCFFYLLQQVSGKIILIIIVKHFEQKFRAHFEQFLAFIESIFFNLKRIDVLNPPGICLF